jgi:hypothetical protein
VSVEWAQFTGADNYHVEISNSSGGVRTTLKQFSDVTSTGSGSYARTETALTTGTVYFSRVRPQSGGVDLADSGWIQFTTS